MMCRRASQPFHAARIYRLLSAIYGFALVLGSRSCCSAATCSGLPARPRDRGYRRSGRCRELLAACRLMRFEGLIRTWDDERGFGFIEPALGGQDIFVHVKAFPRGTARPSIGQRVSFDVEIGPQGRSAPVTPKRFERRLSGSPGPPTPGREPQACSPSLPSWPSTLRPDCYGATRLGWLSST